MKLPRKTIKNSESLADSELNVLSKMLYGHIRFVTRVSVFSSLFVQHLYHSWHNLLARETLCGIANAIAQRSAEDSLSHFLCALTIIDKIGSFLNVRFHVLIITRIGHQIVNLCHNHMATFLLHDGRHHGQHTVYEGIHLRLFACQTAKADEKTVKIRTFTSDARNRQKCLEFAAWLWRYFFLVADIGF